MPCSFFMHTCSTFSCSWCASWSMHFIFFLWAYYHFFTSFNSRLMSRWVNWWLPTLKDGASSKLLAFMVISNAQKLFSHNDRWAFPTILWLALDLQTIRYGNSRSPKYPRLFWGVSLYCGHAEMFLFSFLHLRFVLALHILHQHVERDLACARYELWIWPKGISPQQVLNLREFLP